jgi:ArsR family transcriptional regulator
MHALVQFTHALADETRWRVLQLVFEEALCVCELADILRMPQSSVSSHLQVIRKAGLLESERCEKWIYYRVAKQHRAVLGVLREHFGASPVRDRTLMVDARRARKRLEQRDKSCCPGPRRLTTGARDLTKQQRSA